MTVVCTKICPQQKRMFLSFIYYHYMKTTFVKTLLLSNANVASASEITITAMLVKKLKFVWPLVT